MLHIKLTLETLLTALCGPVKTAMLHIKLKRITNAANGSKYFACRPSPPPPPPPPPPTLGYGVKKSKFKYFACRRPSPLTLGLGSKGQNSTLSEHNHVAYQIKGIMNAATWYQIFCPQTPPLPSLGMGYVGQILLFQNMVIKWNLKMQQHSSKYFAHRPPHAPYRGQ